MEKLRYNSEIVDIDALYYKLFNKYNDPKKSRNQRILANIMFTHSEALTKIKNRKAYSEKIHELLYAYKRYNTVFTMLQFDIDNFKEINQIQFFNLFFENTLSLCFVDEDATIIKPWGKCGTRVDAK